MSKLRADSVWNQLTQEQCDQLEEWLFTENLSFRETNERVQQQFGLTCSLTSVFRFYRRVEKERAKGELDDALLATEEMKELGGNLEGLRATSIKLIGARLLKAAMQQSESKDLATLARVLLESQEKEIQQGRLNLAREKFEFRAAEAVLLATPVLEELAEKDAAREMERIEAVQKQLFGEGKKA